MFDDDRLVRLDDQRRAVDASAERQRLAQIDMSLAPRAVREKPGSAGRREREARVSIGRRQTPVFRLAMATRGDPGNVGRLTTLDRRVAPTTLLAMTEVQAFSPVAPCANLAA